MLPIIICITALLFVVGLFAFMRSQYEVFSLGFLPHKLNRKDYYQLNADIRP